MGKDTGQNSIPSDVPIWHSEEKTYPRDTNRFFLRHGKLQGFPLLGFAWIFSSTVPVDHATRHRMIKETWWTSQETNSRNARVLQKVLCCWIPVCPLQYIAAGTRFVFRGKEGSCARISPNCQNNLDFLVGMLASRYGLACCGRGLVWKQRVLERAGLDPARHKS